ncbi:MAG: Uma2 family endonuclease [Planctomycetaceae bacterium]
MSLLTAKVAPQEGVTYPSSDGKPMAETDLHRNWMFRLIELLLRHFVGTQTYVSGNMLLYYVEGNPKKRVAPDVFVVRGIDPHDRRVYKLWEEGIAPQVVIEVSSKGTMREDLRHKPQIYEQIGVREYFLFDPLAEYLEPALTGFRRIEGDELDTGFVRMEMDDSKSLVSEELGLILRLVGRDLVLIDRQTGERLKTDRECAIEERAARELAEVRATAADDRATAADDRAAAVEAAFQHERLQRLLLEAEIARLRGESH